MMFPSKRMRRYRDKESTRKLLRETEINVDDLIYPIFVEKRDDVLDIPSMEGIKRFPIDEAVKEAEEVHSLGVPAVILFGVPEEKDKKGSFAWRSDGVVQETVRELNKEVPSLTVITDVCLCEYSSHGHCGLIEKGDVNNDETLELLRKISLSHARAGADVVAPSGMMDGMVSTIRSALDKNSFEDVSIMSYSAKYHSNFYGPFRDAAESSPSFGDRRTYQMGIGQREEAFLENQLDVREGADILMVKPAMPYLDIIRDTDNEFDLPLAAYQVSGEYSMIKNAIKNDLMSEKAIKESLISIKRAGADMVLTYFAKEVAKNGI